MKRWIAVHKWSSLICTAFILILCITGLPLIFKAEIDDLFYADKAARELPASTPAAPLHAVLDAARASIPGSNVRFVVWDRDDPHVIVVSLVETDGRERRVHDIRMDARTAEILDVPEVRSRMTFFLLRLHSTLLSGSTGQILLGVMGALFLVATVSGVVLYGPSTRKLRFGTVRLERTSSIRWLDFHNLAGIATVAWVAVVGTTGVMNTASDLMVDAWRSGQLAQMIKAHGNRPQPPVLAPLDDAIFTARGAVPNMEPAFVAFPGTNFSSPGHYLVFMRGTTPLTARLLKPVMIDATDGTLADTQDLPWYMSSLLLSVPLHFGNYGGLPLKIVWALLDLVVIFILLSGIRLWLKKSPGLSRSAVGQIELANEIRP